MHINKMNIPNIKINEKYTNGKNAEDLYSIFGKEYLEQIQRVISDVTGLAFVTIDYKGQPLTEMTNFSKRCKYIRQTPMHKKICELSDASGAIRAAVSKKTSIYFCPFKLLEVAIPIIINDKYLGAFIGGQAICSDPPEKILRMQDQLLLEEIDFSKLDFFDEDADAKKYTYREFESTVKLVELIISELVKREAISSYHEKENKSKIKALEEKLAQVEEKNLELKKKISSINNTVNLLFLNNMMESISNLALIEEAEITSKYSEHFRKFVMNFIDVESNSANFIYKTLIEYFKMKEIQYRDRLKYEISIEDDVRETKMPFKSLITYVIIMSYLGLNFNEDDYEIKVHLKKDSEYFIAIIEDNGLGISEDSFERFKSTHIVSTEIEDINKYLRQMEEDSLNIFSGDLQIKIEENSKNTKIFMKYRLNS
ncbi:PocR ligand-binding domain-containing protein [Peptoniphilus porci]|nr:PocR ligand-binding domain-containing protein [Peptoniphilus porci]